MKRYVLAISATAGAILGIAAVWNIFYPFMQSDPPPFVGLERIEPLEPLPGQMEEVIATLYQMERAGLRSTIETNWRRVCQARESGEDAFEYLNIIGTAQERYRVINNGAEYGYNPPC